MSGTGWLATAVFRRHLWAVLRRSIRGLGLAVDSGMAKSSGISIRHRDSSEASGESQAARAGWAAKKFEKMAFAALLQAVERPFLHVNRANRAEPFGWTSRLY